jgi:transposase
MRIRRLVVTWAEADTPEALWERYRKEGDGEVRSRLHALWLLRMGWRLKEVADAVGVQYRTVQRWVSWYRHGGLDEVCAHRAGGYGQPSWLTPEQEAALAEEAANGTFATAEDARRWVAERFGVTYRPKGIYSVLHRVRCQPKVPRPVHVQADLEAQDAWKKGAA